MLELDGCYDFGMRLARSWWEIRISAGEDEIRISAGVGQLVSCSAVCRNMQHGQKLAPVEILRRFMLSFKQEVSSAPAPAERQAEKCEKSATSLPPSPLRLQQALVKPRNTETVQWRREEGRPAILG